MMVTGNMLALTARPDPLVTMTGPVKSTRGMPSLTMTGTTSARPTATQGPKRRAAWSASMSRFSSTFAVQLAQAIKDGQSTEIKTMKSRLAGT
jgi:hypothetical protein